MIRAYGNTASLARLWKALLKRLGNSYDSTCCCALYGCHGDWPQAKRYVA